MVGKSQLSFVLLAAMFISLLISPYTALAAESVIYSTGFEDDNGGYTTEGSANWVWGTAVNPIGPTNANSGLKCWGTNPLITTGLLEGILDSPPIAIPPLAGNQGAIVSFHAFVDMYTEGIRTEGNFYVSADGKQTWQRLGRFFDTMGGWIENYVWQSGGWQRYQFSLSDYAGKTVNLRFLAKTVYSKPGFYIDDVAVTVIDHPAPTKLLTLEASEDASAVASCPWVYTWNGSEFVQDNDIYSVARQPRGEMRDYYLLQKPLLALNSQYNIEIREVESEDSWTDFLGLLAVDHHNNVAVAPDGKGNIHAYHPAGLIKPVRAVSQADSDALSSVSERDRSGSPLYSNDYVDLDFGNVDVSDGARMLLRIKGFLDGEGEPRPFIGPPAIIVQVRNFSGTWNEVGRLSPRFEWSEGLFDLTPYLPDLDGSMR